MFTFVFIKLEKKSTGRGISPHGKAKLQEDFQNLGNVPRNTHSQAAFLAVVSKLQSSEIGSILDKDERIKHTTVNGFFGKFRETEFLFPGLKGNECTQFSTLLLDFVSIYPLQQSLVPVAAGT